MNLEQYKKARNIVPEIESKILIVQNLQDKLKKFKDAIKNSNTVLISIVNRDYVNNIGAEVNLDVNLDKCSTDILINLVSNDINKKKAALELDIHKLKKEFAKI